MKKNLLSITTILIMIVALFISCSNEVQTGDKVSKVLFTSDYNMTRGLNSSSPAFDVNQYYWTYEAQKMDNSGLKTGETEGSVPVIKVEAGTPEVKGLGVSVGPFSLGTWKFILQAHEGSTSGNILYTGVASNVVITDNPNGNKVSIKVHSLQSSHGYVEIAEGIGLKDSYGNPVLEYTEQITFSKAATPDVVETLPVPEGRVYTVPSGSWKVTIAYLSTSNPDIAYGRNSIYVNVFDNQKVVIGGSLEEITGNTSFETTVDGGTKAIAAPVQVTASAGAKLEVSSSPAAPESTAAKTEIQIPANALKSEGEAKLSITSYDSPVASKVFTVADGNGTAIAGLDINLSIAGKPAEFNDYVTVSTYIAKGLPVTPKVVYNGGGEAMQPKEVTYDTASGLLTFKTNHFSQYYVVADADIININTGKAYAHHYTPLKMSDGSEMDNPGFRIAMIEANSGDTLVLLSDIELSNKDYTYITVDKALTLDLNGHVLNCSSNWTFLNIVGGDLTVENGSMNYFTPGQHMFYLEDGNLTINNGSYKTISNGNGVSSIIFSGTRSKVVINGGTFDGSNSGYCVTTNGNKGNINEIIINDGTFSGIVYFPCAGSLTINNGTFTNDAECLYVKGGKLTIENGSFSATGDRSAAGKWKHNGNGSSELGSAVIIEGCDYPAGEPSVKISGGSFNGFSNKNYGILVIDWRNSSSDTVHAVDRSNIGVPYAYVNLVGPEEHTLDSKNVEFFENGNSCLYVSANVAESGNGTKIAPLKTINEALANPDTEVIYVGEGTYVENIVIPESRKVSIVGLGTPVVKKDVYNRAVKADDLSKATTIKGIVDISSKADVVLDNIILTNDINVDSKALVDNSMLIRSKASQFDMTIKDCLLTSAEVGKISSVVRENYQKTDVVDYTVINTCVELHKGHAKINDATLVNGFDFTIADDKDQNLCSVINFNMKDSSITASENASNYVYPIRIRKASKVGGSIVNSRIENPKNQYPLWLVLCGDKDGEESVFNITGSMLSGYSSIYMKANENFVCNATDSDLIGNNYNSGDWDDFSTFCIQNSINTRLIISNSRIGVNQYAKAAMFLANVGYVDYATQTHNKIDIKNSTLNLYPVETPAEGRAFYSVEQFGTIQDQNFVSQTDNAVMIDEVTLAGRLLETGVPELIGGTENSYEFTTVIK